MKLSIEVCANNRRTIFDIVWYDSTFASKKDVRDEQLDTWSCVTNDQYRKNVACPPLQDSETIVDTANESHRIVNGLTGEKNRIGRWSTSHLELLHNKHAGYKMCKEDL